MGAKLDVLLKGKSTGWRCFENSVFQKTFGPKKQ